MIDPIKGLFLVKKQQSRLVIILINQIYEVPNKMNRAMYPPSIDCRLGLMYYRWKDQVQSHRQQLSKYFYVNIHQSNRSIICQQTGFPPLLIDQCSNGHIFVSWKSSPPHLINEAQVHPLDTRPKALIEFGRNSIRTRRFSPLQLFDSLLKFLLSYDPIKGGPLISRQPPRHIV